MSERIHMTHDDVKNFTAHSAQANDIKNREFFKNLGKNPEASPIAPVKDAAEAIASSTNQ